MYLHFLQTLILKFQEKQQITYPFKPDKITLKQQKQQKKTKKKTSKYVYDKSWLRTNKWSLYQCWISREDNSLWFDIKH